MEASCGTKVINISPSRRRRRIYSQFHLKLISSQRFYSSIKTKLMGSVMISSLKSFRELLIEGLESSGV